jgi:predicted  nucleic acid-binding Zn-ribbon protein
MKIEELRKNIDRLWKVTKKDLEKASKETTELIKKGEEYIKDISERGRKKLEMMGFALKREKLYYELGKTISGLSKGRWLKSKKIGDLVSQIKKIDRLIKKR